MRDGWVETKLVDAVEVLDRFRKPINSTEREGRQGSVPYYGANGQAGWIDDSIFNEELVLLGEDAIDFADPNARKAYLISGPSWVNNHAHVLRAKPEKVYSYFLAESLNKVDYSQYVSFGTRSKLTQGSMNGIKVLLPPLPEQKRIVDLLSSVDSYIEALQKQLESAKKSRIAILHELLTTGGDDWVETTLGQISKCAGGCAFPDAFQGNKEGIPFIKVSDMNSQDNEKYIETSNNSVSAEVVDDLRLRIWDKGTVIFPKVGAALLTEKRRILTAKTIFDNNIMGLVPNERVLSEFLFLLMLKIRFSDHVQPGAVPSVKNSIVEAISVLLPSLDEQKRIVTIISELDSFIHCTETSMNRTKALRSGLLSQLLSGEHEIPVSYDKVMGAA
jgi:type I restriction enzyme S subunit